MSVTPGKSILKKTAQAPSTGTASTPQSERDRKNLDLALQHAYVIQYQKDVQAKILSAIEELLDVPASGTFTAPEAQRFINLAQLFQPSDYDAVIEERRIYGRCGYALCSRAPRTVDPARAWKFPKGSGDWCSETCAKKALYVKTQLSEVPAWERRTDEMPDIVLHGDDREEASLAAAESSRTPVHTPAKAQPRLTNSGHTELAQERGEKTASFKPNQVMTESIVEKTVTGKSGKQNQTLPASKSHNSIEGYEPRGVQKPKARFADEAGGSLLDDIDLNTIGFQGAKVSGMLPDEEHEDEDS